VLPGPGQRVGLRRQGPSLPVRVGDGTGRRLSLLVLPGPSRHLRHLRHLRQGPRLLVRVGNGTGRRLGLPRDGGGLLARRGIRLSSSQVYRLVAERPERLSLNVLMALLDILDCSIAELIEPVAAGRSARNSKVDGGEQAGARARARSFVNFLRRGGHGGGAWHSTADHPRIIR
jgi:hypothetical protein